MKEVAGIFHAESWWPPPSLLFLMTIDRSVPLLAPPGFFCLMSVKKMTFGCA
jgi:hypothetical protein